MVIVEKLFGWLLLGIVGAMVVVGGAGAALAGLSGLMASPGVVLVVLVVLAAGVLLLGLPVALGAMWAWRWWLGCWWWVGRLLGGVVEEGVRWRFAG